MINRNIFQFKQFSINQENAPFKVGTDSVLLGSVIDFSHSKKVLDIGTGTGILALMAAQRSHAEITAIEPDKTAYEIAKQNFNHSPWNNSIHCINQGWKTFSADNAERFDLIFSNPPYFTAHLRESEGNHPARHSLSLSGAMILQSAAPFLNDTGSVWMITPIEQLSELTLSARSGGLFLTHKMEVIGVEGKAASRIITTWKKHPIPILSGSITILDRNNQRTEQYQHLVGSFLIK